MHIVYEIWNPFTIECFYVGKTNTKYKMRRLREHRREVTLYSQGETVLNPFKARTWQKIIDLGAKPECFVIAGFEDERDCHDEERRLIAHYGRRDLGKGTLTNLTDGGEGSSGKRFSPESIRKMSEAKIGKPLSPERKEQLRISSLNIKAKRGTKLGTRISEEHKKKISMAKKGRPSGNGDSFRGRTHTAETRAKMSLAHQNRKNKGNNV